MCTREGDVIAASDGIRYDEPLLDALEESGVVDETTANAAWKVFEGA